MQQTIYSCIVRKIDAIYSYFIYECEFSLYWVLSNKKKWIQHSQTAKQITLSRFFWVIQKYIVQSVQFDFWWLLWVASFLWIKNIWCNWFSLNFWWLLLISESQNTVWPHRPIPKTSDSYKLKKMSYPSEIQYNLQH